MVLPVYIFQRFAFRLFRFFEHWYVDGFKSWSHSAISFLESLDKVLAMRVSVRHIFSPLFQDRSFVGYSLGFIFRLFRIFCAGAVYFFVALFFVATYAAWALLPPFLIFKTFFN